MEKTGYQQQLFFNLSKNSAETSLWQQSLIAADSGSTWEANVASGSKNQNHRLALRADLNLSEKDEIFYAPQVTLQQYSDDKKYNGIGLLEGLPYSYYNTFYTSSTDASNIDNMILWRHRFDTKGRTVSIRFSQGQEKRSGSSEQLTREYSIESVIISDKKTWDYDTESDAYNVLDTLYSKVFENRSQSHEASIGLRYRKNTLSIMGRGSVNMTRQSYVETYPNDIELIRDHINILARLSVRYRLNTGNSFNLMARSSTVSPSLDQLQETPDLSDPLQIENGSHLLRQQVQTNVFARYHLTNKNKGNYSFFMLGGTITQDYIGNRTIIAESDTTLANGIILAEGGKYIEPTNLDGYYSLRSFAAYSMPLSFMRSNLNLNLALNYSHVPGLINGDMNYAHSPSATVGAVLSSNISKRFDLTASSNTTLKYSYNTLPNTADLRTLNQRSYYWNFWKNTVLRDELSHQFYRGMSGSYNQSSLVTNMSLGFKMLKNNAGELTLTGYDLLNQSNTITRTVSDTEIRDVETNVFGRYYMLTFTYTFKKGNLSARDQEPHRREPPAGADGPPDGHPPFENPSPNSLPLRF